MLTPVESPIARSRKPPAELTNRLATARRWPIAAGHPRALSPQALTIGEIALMRKRETMAESGHLDRIEYAPACLSTSLSGISL